LRDIFSSYALYYAFFVLYSFFITVNITAQSEDKNIYVINSYNYHVDGITKDYALDYRTGFKIGEEITGVSNLERFLQEKTQLLVNERLFESVRIEHKVGKARVGGKFPVDLDIYIKDTWNIIAFPYPEYSSNTGFEFAVKGLDSNFLGTMSPLKLSIGYLKDTEGLRFFNLNIDPEIPVKLFGLYWKINFDHDLSYSPDTQSTWYYENITGISAEIPVSRTTLTVGFAESIFVNQENPVKYRNEYGRYQEGLYLSSNPYILWEIPTGLFINNIGELKYTPSISAVFNHELEKWPLADFLKGPFLEFSHTIELGRVDWAGNFRKGTSISIGNSFSYNFYNRKNDMEPWGADLNVSAQGHFVFNEYAGLSSRLLYRHWFFDDYGEVTAKAVGCGDVLRGILDNEIDAKYMLSLNVDVTLLIFKFRPSEWFGGSNFWRVFDFDLHLAPVIDAAIYSSNSETQSFNMENLQLTAGFEFIIFPKRWNSLFLRISYGRDFSFGHKKSQSELFIGTEFHYY